MKRIFTTITFFIFITVNLYAVNFYVDQHHKNASDTTADSQGLSWSKPFKSPTYAYEQTVDNRGDSIHIAQGFYEFKNDVTYEITLSKRNVAWIGYGEVWFEGLGKLVNTNNNMFSVSGIDRTSKTLNISNIRLMKFYVVFTPNFINFENISAVDQVTIDDCSYGLSFIYGSQTNTTNGNQLNFKNSIVKNTTYAIYTSCGGSTGYNYNSYLFNNTFFNTQIACAGNYGRLYQINNNLFDSTTLSIIQLSGENNNFYNSTTSKPGTNPSFFNPLFNDTNPLNPVLTLRRESPVRNISTTGSFLGARGVADYSSANDTLTWSDWYSWISANDSVLIYNDTAFIVDTDGLTLQYGSQYPKYRRITRVFSNLGTIYGTPLKSFSNQKEVFNTGDYIDYWAVIDYDTSTSIREYRYIASNEEITNDDLKENSGKWTAIGFNEPLPTLTVRYFAVEVFFRYNF